MSIQPTRRQHVLIVAHGSRSPKWVAAQRDWWAQLDSNLRLQYPEITTELCFLEIAPPLFESRLEFWKNHPELTSTNLHVFPFFLSKSGHASEDIPEIIEQAELPSPPALIQPIGWPTVLAQNAERRLAAYGANPEIPVIISGYGASHHDHLWQELLRDIQACSVVYRDQPKWLWAPSGHFFEDYTVPLRRCLQCLKERRIARCAVLPLYLAVSSYQEQLIPNVSAEFPEIQVLTGMDSILPDPLVVEWGVEQIRLHLAQPEVHSPEFVPSASSLSN